MTVAPRATVLRVLPDGSIPLRRRHQERLGDQAWAAVAEELVAPGLYRVVWNGAVSVHRLARSRLADGQPVRFCPSPIQRGPVPKPVSPSAWDALRVDDVATLLTDPAGQQLYESCVAAVVAWNGSALVMTPNDTPRVASLAEAALGANEAMFREPLLVESNWPLLLINAVAVAEPSMPHRGRFPAEQRARIMQVLSSEDA